MIVKEEGGGFTELEPGIYDAVCYGLVDIGTQTDPVFNKTQHKAILKFELLDELYDDNGEEKRRIFSQFYTLSLHEKAKLRRHLNGWRGKEFTKDELAGFEMENILGKNCVLVVAHTEKGKAVIESISKYKKEPADSSRPHEYFSFDDFEGEFPAWMTDGIIGLCQKSKEFHAFIEPSVSEERNEIAEDEEDFEEVPF